MINHFAFRLALWRKGYTPLNLIRFLDGCSRLILLKKVGGAETSDLRIRGKW
jgi:hypothetical protein